MKKLTKYPALLWVAVIMATLSSCVKNEFSVAISLPKDAWGNYHIYYYASDSRGGLWIETTAPLHDGAYEIKGITRRPTVVCLSQKAGLPPSVVLYAERGDKFILQGASPEALTWTLDKGNEISKELSAWRLVHLDALRLDKESSVNGAVALQVREHPDALASAIILSLYYRRAGHEQAFADLWNALSDDVREKGAALLEGVPGSGMIPPFEYAPAYRLRVRGAKVPLRSMRLPTPEGKRQIIKSAGTSGAIWLFSRPKDFTREGDRDTLKALAKAYPDSAGRLIADISFETDSVSWRYAARQDSLRKIVQGWIPTGEADARVRALGIPSTPWWIVTDSVGKRLYSGPDADQAAAAFRRQLKAKP